MIMAHLRAETVESEYLVLPSIARQHNNKIVIVDVHTSALLYI